MAIYNLPPCDDFSYSFYADFSYECLDLLWRKEISASERFSLVTILHKNLLEMRRFGKSFADSLEVSEEIEHLSSEFHYLKKTLSHI